MELRRSVRWAWGVATAAWREAPYLARLGVTVVVLGAAGDTVAHAIHPRTAQGFTVPQQTAHLVILLGMVLTLAGVLLHVRRQGGRRHRVGHFKEVHSASRGR